jgi:TonB family protein
MNRQAMADELDQHVEMLLTGKHVVGAKSEPLLALASELRMLPTPEFKSRLKDELVEPCPATALPQLVNFERIQTSVLAGITPLFGAKRAGLLPADHRSFLVSFASHAALIALIASGIFVIRGPFPIPTSSVSELTYPLAGHGGGGSGDRSVIQATRGTPPKFSDEQITPPAIVVPKSEPRLPVDATVLGPPNLKLPESNRIGDLVSSNIVMPSNGTGSGGSAGDGKGTGVGRGEGAGVGAGRDIGVGGGPYRSTMGITAPRAVYDPEPEYSDEARRVKHQGVVVLALVVDPQGHTRDIRVARSLGMGLDEKAIEAVRKWQFNPGTKDGVPVAVQVNVEVNFKLY